MARRRSVVLVVFLTLMGLFVWRTLRTPRVSAPSDPPAAERQWATPGAARERVTLLEVVDGDTVRVRWRGRRESVRLLRIDTPERPGTSHQPTQGYGAARSSLRELIGSGPLELEFEEPGAAARDDYGRLLAYLWVDGRNLNIEQVRRGWSEFWTRYGEGRHAAQFGRAGGEARAAGAGLCSGRYGRPPRWCR